ncbi:MAG: Gfo/Idh/MocA family oxidoreductase [Caldilineaceae bacterium]
MTKVHAALLGIEHPHSLAHMRTLQALPEVEAIYLWDENQQALDAAVQAQGAKVVATYTDLDELLANKEIFFVIAAVRNDLGPDLFIRTLQAGKHLMAEKPIGRTAADTEQVIAVAKAAGLKLGVCYQNRNNPVVQEARRLVQQGAIGQLMSIEFRMLTTQVQFRNPHHWLFDHAKSGGGILSWLGCHYLDLMRYISGDEIVAVSAEVATRSGEAIDVEDVATLSLRFRSGAIGSFHAGYTLALSGGGYHNSSGYDTYAGFNGRGGRIYWSSPSSPTRLSLESTHPDHSSAPWYNSDYTLATSPAYGGVAGEEFIRRFLGAAQGDGEPMAGGNDALQIARIVDAAYESSRSGRRVEIAVGNAST